MSTNSRALGWLRLAFGEANAFAVLAVLAFIGLKVGAYSLLALHSPLMAVFGFALSLALYPLAMQLTTIRRSLKA